MTLTAERKYRLLLELSQRISRTLDLQVVLDDGSAHLLMIEGGTWFLEATYD